jgi:LPXTG-motif cell wall-anchored protein
MKWYNNTGDDSGVGSGVLLPEFQTPTTVDTTPAATTPPTLSSGSGISTDSLTQILTTGLQIGGSISQQRRASGASANRQARLAACGRRPLFGKARKNAYDKCVADAQGGGTYLPPSPTQPRSSNTLLFVGLGVALLGVVGYVIYKRNK